MADKKAKILSILDGMGVVSSIALSIGDKTLTIENLSGNQMQAIADGDTVVSTEVEIYNDEGELSAVSLKHALSLALQQYRLEPVMSLGMQTKIARKGAYTSAIPGLQGIEYVTRSSMEIHAGGVGNMPGNYLVTVPQLWTEFGLHFYSDQSTPYGKVGLAGETVAQLCLKYGWDFAECKKANRGRGIPLESKFDRDVVIFPPLYKEPKTSFVHPGGQEFLSLFDEKKGRKYSSALYSAPVFEIQELELWLHGTCKWVPEDAEYNDTEWVSITVQDGKRLLSWNIDGRHYMNRVASDLFDAKKVQFRTKGKELISAVKGAVNEHQSNFEIAKDAVEAASLLKMYAENPDAEGAMDSLMMVPEEYLELTEDVQATTKTFAGKFNPAILCGTTLAGGIKVKGVLERAIELLEKPNTDVSLPEKEKFMFKGVAQLLNWKELTHDPDQKLTSGPALFAWFCEAKGKYGPVVEASFVEEAKKFMNNGGEVFELNLNTNTSTVLEVIGYPAKGNGSWGYQQMDSAGTELSMTKEDNAAVLSELAKLKKFKIAGFDSENLSSREDWLKLYLQLQAQTGFGSGDWDERILRRLKSDPENKAKMEADENWLKSVEGSEAYRQTADAMAGILFKGGMVKTMFLDMEPPTPHQAAKLASKGADVGYVPIPFFWEGNGHGEAVWCVTSRSPVVTMNNPFFGLAIISKHVDGHVCPQELCLNALVGDWDGDQSTDLVYTPYHIWVKLSRKNQIVALMQNILVCLYSRKRIDEWVFDVEAVPKDKNFSSAEVVNGDSFLWDSLNLEGNQGQMGINAFAYSYKLATGLMTPMWVEQAGNYQSAIDLQGKVLVSSWSATAADIEVNGRTARMGESGWEKAVAFDPDAVAFALYADPANRSRTQWDLNRPHWEIVTPPFMKAKLQQWARSQKHSQTGSHFVFEMEHMGKLWSFKVHRNVVFGYDKEIVFQNGSKSYWNRGIGLAEINPASVSLPVYNRYLSLKLGLGKKQSIRDLAWINPKWNWFAPDPEANIGGYSCNTPLLKALVGFCDGVKFPIPETFWCPTSDQPLKPEILAVLDETLLSEVKISAYTSFLTKDVCKELASNFLSYLPFFQFTKSMEYWKRFLAVDFGDLDGDELVEAEVKFIELMGTPEFWDGSMIGIEDGQYQPKWVSRRLERIQEIEDASMRTEEINVLVDDIEANWPKVLSSVQRLYSMIVMNAAEGSCKLHEEIVPKYKDAGSSNELYVALVEAHGQKHLRCPECRKAFLANSTPSEADEAKGAFTYLHKLLVLVDKNIDRIQLVDDSGLLGRLQKERKMRFEEARGISPTVQGITPGKVLLGVKGAYEKQLHFYQL